MGPGPVVVDSQRSNVNRGLGRGRRKKHMCKIRVLSVSLGHFYFQPIKGRDYVGTSPKGKMRII